VSAQSALLDGIVDTSDDAIITCDAVGRVLTWPAPAERLFGRTADDAVGHDLVELFAGHLRDEVRTVTALALGGERIKHFESEVIRGDGLPVPVWLSFRRIGEGDDGPGGALVIVRDITEQRVAQATLAEVEARLRDGEALAQVGSWMWDVRTDAVQWSIEFHRIHGVNPLTFDGTLESHLHVVHPEDRDRVHSGLAECVESGRPFEVEYRIVRPDGEVRLVHVRAQPSIGSAGAAVGLRGIGQDVTEQPASTLSRSRPDS
jgi:PAS domain S-box-containing protein